VTGGQLPKSVQIIYKGGSVSRVIQSIGIPVAVTASTQPVVMLVAGFSGTPVSGNNPLGVQFTDSSTGPVASYSWDFGDLGTSTAKNPYHQYASRGTYTVSLTVRNGASSDTTTKSGYITVYDAPVVANFTATPLNGTAPLTVQFTDLSTGPVNSWNWSFGDGNLSTYENPSFTYVRAGKYNVSLTAGNGTGNNTMTKLYYITVRSTQACFYDNFEGNSINATAWTIAGGNWVQSNGVVSQNLDNQGDPKKLVLTNSGITWGNNLTITSKVRIDSWSNGDFARGGVSLFSSPGVVCNDPYTGCGYNLLFHYTTTNPHNYVQWLDDYVEWISPGYVYAFNNNQWYWFKMNMSQGTMYGRIWADGSTEPTDWPYTWTKSGRTGYPALNGGATMSGGSSRVSFMNVTVCRNGDI
jgi:PKD repeat protein